MEQNVTETTLSSERLGGEGRIRAVLAGWGLDAQAVARMLEQHRAAVRAAARRESLRGAPRTDAPAPRRPHAPAPH